MFKSKSLLTIVAVVMAASINPSFAGKTKAELEAAGFTCGRIGVGGYSCTKPGEKEHLCDNDGKCESLRVQGDPGGKKQTRFDLHGVTPKVIQKNINPG